MPAITVIERLPTVDEFLALRDAVGWGGADGEATTRSLRNSLYGVCLMDGAQVIGCGRVIGDGGLCFYVQDIIVAPTYQRQGYGRQIMDRVMAYVDAQACRGGFVGLMAAKGVEDFYRAYGFVARPSDQLGSGMIRFWP